MSNKKALEKMTADNALNETETKLILARNKRMKETGLSSVIIRSFSINNFGIWNCDHPQLPNNAVPLITSYTDSLNQTLDLGPVAVVFKNF
jgi:hypothetical protein